MPWITVVAVCSWSGRLPGPRSKVGDYRILLPGTVFVADEVLRMATLEGLEIPLWEAA